MTQALLVSLSAPEMDRLAVELAARRSLVGVVRRYINKNRWWERTLARLPTFGGLYTSTLGRRLPPAGLDGSLVIEAGVPTDIAAAVTGRLGRRVPKASQLANSLMSRTEQDVARAASRYVTRSDVVVASYHVAFPAFKRARECGRRTVLNYPIAHHRWQYGMYAEMAQRYPEFAPALPRFGSSHSAVLDREIELADLILVGSRFAHDSFVSQGIPPERLRIIPYGADSQRFMPAPDANRNDARFRILFVGQIGERKGVSHLLKAYQAFRKPDTELHLVGDYMPGAEVYAPYGHLYRHTPNVAQTRLPHLFRAADVFVFPTLVEGLGMVVLEAMACGLPVIVTPNGPGEVVRDGVDGYVVPSCDPEAIVDRLERLYADADLRRAMGRNARQQAETWSWERYAHAAAETVLSREPVR